MEYELIDGIGLCVLVQFLVNRLNINLAGDDDEMRRSLHMRVFTREEFGQEAAKHAQCRDNFSPIAKALKVVMEHSTLECTPFEKYLPTEKADTNYFTSWIPERILLRVERDTPVQPADVSDDDTLRSGDLRVTIDNARTSIKMLEQAVDLAKTFLENLRRRPSSPMIDAIIQDKIREIETGEQNIKEHQHTIESCEEELQVLVQRLGQNEQVSEQRRKPGTDERVVNFVGNHLMMSLNRHAAGTKSFHYENYRNVLPTAKTAFFAGKRPRPVDEDEGNDDEDARP